MDNQGQMPQGQQPMSSQPEKGKGGMWITVIILILVVAGLIFYFAGGNSEDADTDETGIDVEVSLPEGEDSTTE